MQISLKTLTKRIFFTKCLCNSKKSATFAPTNNKFNQLKVSKNEKVNQFQREQQCKT